MNGIYGVNLAGVKCIQSSKMQINQIKNTLDKKISVPRVYEGVGRHKDYCNTGKPSLNCHKIYNEVRDLH